MTTGKTTALTRQTFVGKVMSLLFNMLSRMVIAFLPRSKCLLISHLQSPSVVILEPPKIKSHCFHFFPICHKVDSKEIKPVHPKGNQPWIFIGRTDAKAEASILWPPDEKSWLTGKDPDAGEDWWHEEKGTAEDEMVGWHHQCNGHEFEQTLGDGEGQESLSCCSPWGHKKSDTT